MADFKTDLRASAIATLGAAENSVYAELCSYASESIEYKRLSIVLKHIQSARAVIEPAKPEGGEG